MPKKVRDERKRFWLDLVERQAASGLTIATFCAEAGVSQNSFYVWKKRLGTAAPDRQATTPRRKHRGKKAVTNSLVPVRVIPDVSRQPLIAHAIEIAWPSGIVLRVAPGCDSKTLCDVFGLLSSVMKNGIRSC